MTEKILHLLDKIISNKRKKEKRDSNLLKNPSVDHAVGWYMLVKPFFNNALDIQLTEIVKDKSSQLVWTQGSSFSFDIGDVLHANNIDPQTAPGPCVTQYIQIQKAIKVNPPNNERDRYPGYVFFSEWRYDREKNMSVKQDRVMTQDDFVRFLIVGHSDNK